MPHRLVLGAMVRDAITRPMRRALTAWYVPGLYSRVLGHTARSAMIPAELPAGLARGHSTPGGEAPRYITGPPERPRQAACRLHGSSRKCRYDRPSRRCAAFSAPVPRHRAFPRATPAPTHRAGYAELA